MYEMLILSSMDLWLLDDGIVKFYLLLVLFNRYKELTKITGLPIWDKSAGYLAKRIMFSILIAKMFLLSLT